MCSSRSSAEKLGELLKELRIERGLKQKQVVSEIAGLTIAQLSNYERGRTDPGTEMMIKLCEYYGVSADYLYGLSRNRENLTFDIDLSKANLFDCMLYLEQSNEFERRVNERMSQHLSKLKRVKRPIRGKNNGSETSGR